MASRKPTAQTFLVLELVAGESLDARVAQGPIPIDEALGIARQIGDALRPHTRRGSSIAI